MIGSSKVLKMVAYNALEGNTNMVHYGQRKKRRGINPRFVCFFAHSTTRHRHNHKQWKTSKTHTHTHTNSHTYTHLQVEELCTLRLVQGCDGCAQDKLQLIASVFALQLHLAQDLLVVRHCKKGEKRNKPHNNTHNTTYHNTTPIHNTQHATQQTQQTCSLLRKKSSIGVTFGSFGIEAKMRCAKRRRR